MNHKIHFKFSDMLCLVISYLLVKKKQQMFQIKNLNIML